MILNNLLNLFFTLVSAPKNFSLDKRLKNLKRLPLPHAIQHLLLQPDPEDYAPSALVFEPPNYVQEDPIPSDFAASLDSIEIEDTDWENM